MVKVPNELPDGSRRAPSLQEFLQRFVDYAQVPDDVVNGSDHPYECTCTCETCRGWWRGCGRDPDTDLYGPFGFDLDDEYEAIKDFATSLGSRTVWSLDRIVFVTVFDGREFNGKSVAEVISQAEAYDEQRT